MIKILFICHGNICRSPMAEFILKDMVEKQHIADRFEIASAATSSEEIWNGVGNPVYPPAREELSRHGISCKGKRARQIEREDYDKYDLIIYMEQYNYRNLMRILGSDADNKVVRLLDLTDTPGDIADPWYSGNFELTYSQIERGCRAIVEKFK
jgi:protein-tyrosine phosphatase